MVSEEVLTHRKTKHVLGAWEWGRVFQAEDSKSRAFDLIPAQGRSVIEWLKHGNLVSGC